jgi:L-2-amino-thiazoline-4-carboxylic acid hydrolase
MFRNPSSGARGSPALVAKTMTSARGLHKVARVRDRSGDRNVVEKSSASAGAAAPATIDEMGVLTRRRIEAAIIAPIYDEMRQAIGEKPAQEILRRAIRRAAIDAGRTFAAATPGGTNLKSFQDIQHLWTKDDALGIEVVEASADKFDFNVRRCRYAETYREMGMAEIGHLLSCNRDGAFCEGYDPRIKLTRTQTIMGGASHCDFRYRFTPDGDDSKSA